MTRGSSLGRSRRCAKIILEYGARCHYCKKMTNDKLPTTHPLFRTIEHIVPRCVGGHNAPWNLVIACQKCNSDFGPEVYKCFCSICVNARVQFELQATVLNAFVLAS